MAHPSKKVCLLVIITTVVLEMDLNADTSPVGREGEVSDYEKNESDIKELKR